MKILNSGLRFKLDLIANLDDSPIIHKKQAWSPLLISLKPFSCFEPHFSK